MTCCKWLFLDYSHLLLISHRIWTILLFPCHIPLQSCFLPSFHGTFASHSNLSPAFLAVAEIKYKGSLMTSLPWTTLHLSCCFWVLEHISDLRSASGHQQGVDVPTTLGLFSCQCIFIARVAPSAHKVGDEWATVIKWVCFCVCAVQVVKERLYLKARENGNKDDENNGNLIMV